VTKLACESCSSTEGPLDLDVKSDPPERVCRKCIKMPKCPSCRFRRNRLMLFAGGDAICGLCVRRNAREETKRNTRACTACFLPIDVTETNDHGECQTCSTARLYREHPIVANARMDDILDGFAGQAPIRPTNLVREAILVLIGDLPGIVRETVRLVVSMHGLVLCRAGEVDVDARAMLTPAQLEALLTDVGNSVARQLTLAAIEAANATL
jgi:hypothetical protein